MRDLSPQSPEARRKRLARLRAQFGDKVVDRIKPGSRLFEVVKRVLVGVYNDGFIHAGNLAYLALLALFPFFILAAAVASLLGQTEYGQQTVIAFLRTMPPEVANVVRAPIRDVLEARSGPLLWFGAIVGLWTAGSFVETIRDILRRAYGVKYCAPFWEYRLGSVAIIFSSVVLLMFSFAASVMLTSAHEFVLRLLPVAEGTGTRLGIYKLVPALALYGTFYTLFFALTPRRYRRWGCLNWPGPALVTVWWIGTTTLLPDVIDLFGGYARTYGSLAGVMVALLYFFVIGLGVVAAAELNAALAEPHGEALKGEMYRGPFSDRLEVEEPEEDEVVEKEPVGAL